MGRANFRTSGHHIDQFTWALSVPWTATAPWLARERTESLADCFSRTLPTVMAESSEDEGRLLLNALGLAVVRTGGRWDAADRTIGTRGERGSDEPERRTSPFCSRMASRSISSSI